MAKVLVAYDTKYGNTKRVAELIAEGLRETESMDVTLFDIKHEDLESALEFEAILVGAPNHVGRPTRTFNKFIDQLAKKDHQAKQMAAFDTYMGGDFEKAMKKMEKRAREKLPSVSILSPGLSIRVTGMKGPIDDSELPKCTEFGRRLASQLLN
ncbi:MAG: flavodoxin family protein [Candidatus Thorarchaeota archaeon]